MFWRAFILILFSLSPSWNSIPLEKTYMSSGYHQVRLGIESIIFIHNLKISQCDCNCLLVKLVQTQELNLSEGFTKLSSPKHFHAEFKNFVFSCFTSKKYNLHKRNSTTKKLNCLPMSVCLTSLA